MDVKVLGACCKTSQKMLENTKEAVKMMGLDVEVENIGDIEEISKYGIMTTPGLVVDGKVLSYGKLLKPKAIVKLIKKMGS
ncbi:small redox-active disulfide protein 2 [Natranaerovirga hydrolytica]|uniref:Small redox-active disulfide protein 2 n=1 Tax=Natranaerovirga hydrolytica TaxID=680378 RepID=A0A4R1MZW6_9FIRM|nr:thioredoxin family protein [Natranaerovirga hydrolytica]TCK98745.1 small redox-active disulfide protein 2 [Natranaerovirga hydrolytica]